MKLEFDDDINEILSDIKKLNINNKQENIDELPKKRIIGGNNYALEQHLRKQNYLSYKREAKNNPDIDEKVINYNIIETNEDLINFIDKNEYKKSWNRLDNYQKDIKLKEFIDNLVKINKINNNLKNNLYKELTKMIKTTKSKNIEYDKDNTIIKSVKNLKILDDKSYILK
tara:strand:- start:379 stop:891 length:513 start_codon:yes stop_codon:yes gene_type:complete